MSSHWHRERWLNDSCQYFSRRRSEIYRHWSTTDSVCICHKLVTPQAKWLRCYQALLYFTCYKLRGDMIAAAPSTFYWPRRHKCRMLRYCESSLSLDMYYCAVSTWKLMDIARDLVLALSSSGHFSTIFFTGWVTSRYLHMWSGPKMLIYFTMTRFVFFRYVRFRTGSIWSAL